MKGIDIPIAKQMTQFENKLWTDKEFSIVGRIQRDEVFNRRPIPMMLIPGTKEYRDVLLDSNFDARCFFDVLSNRGNNRATVWICFIVNLEKLYPNVSERATEYAHADVKNLLLQGPFTPTGLITDLAAFREYDLIESSDNLQPFYLFRFTTDIIYQNNC